MWQRCLLAAVLLLCWKGAVQAGEYSSTPLSKNQFLSTAEWAVEFARFNNWLNGNYQTIPKERIPAVREHLYLIIDSIVKGQHSENRSQFNDTERKTLSSLFNWGTLLEMYGTGLTARHFYDNNIVKPANPLLPPKPFMLTLEFPYFQLASRSGGWKVSFPYYFMLGNLSQFKANNGMETELVILSTSFAAHKGIPGRSQCTIMLIFSPTKNLQPFRDFWLKNFGLNSSHRAKTSLLPEASLFEFYDPKQHMHTEVSFLKNDKGSLAIAFLGLNGTYQTNRVSYLDFINNLSFD